MAFDFDTMGGGSGGSRRDLFSTGSPRGVAQAGAESWWVRVFGGGSTSRDERRREAEAQAAGLRGAYRIPGGSRKDVLTYLALAVWRDGDYVPKEVFPQVRGHDLPGDDEGEAKLLRALSRTSMGVIENALGSHLRDKTVVVEGHLAGTARTAIERLGAEVEELALEDEKRYIDMTPMIFIVAAGAMMARYIALGLDDQQLYILAGIFFALMYGLRPFFFKMQRPGDS